MRRLAFALLFASAPIACAPPPPREKPPAPTVVVMFVDLTASIGDEAAIQSLADVAEKVVKQLPWSSRLHVYPVDSSRSVKPLVDEFVRPERAAKPSDKKAPLEHAAKLRASILDRRKEYLAESAQSEPLSCLLRTMQTAHDILARYPHHGGRFELVYLSDMVEDCADLDACGDKKCGRMSLTREGYERASQTLGRYKPDFSLGFARVTVVTPPRSGGSNTPNVGSDEIQKFWMRAFSIAGLKADRSEALFLADLPSDFLAPDGGDQTAAVDR